MAHKHRCLPSAIKRELRARVKRLLANFCTRLAVQRAYVGFVNAEGIVEITSASKYPDDAADVLSLRWTEGLTGAAMSRKQIVAWPEDEEFVSFYKEVDRRVSAEITGPFCLSGRVVGTVWFDSLEAGRTFGADGKKIVAEIIEQLEREIAELYEKQLNHRKELDELARRCLVATDSKRGYIAIKRIDGNLEYFKVGDNVETFRDLSQLEGICGWVLQKGEPLNVPDVRNDVRYIPSEERVRSEIAVPILDDDMFLEESEDDDPERVVVTLGLINMESYRLNAYEEAHEIILSRFAREAAMFSRLYRSAEATESGLGISELVEFVLPAIYVQNLPEFNAVEPEGWIVQKLCESARRVLGGVGASWVARGEEGQADIEVVTQGTAKAIIGRDKSGAVILTGRVLHEGEEIGMVRVEFAPSADISSAGLMRFEQICVVGEALISNFRRECRQNRFMSLVSQLNESSLAEVSMMTCVAALPYILNSRHCTLFLRACWAQRPVLIPGPSSCGLLIAKVGCAPFYELDERDGLTAFVACANKSLFVPDLSNEDSLRALSTQLTWRKKIVEEEGAQTRAFMAVPIRDPARDDSVLGVLRTYRSSSGSPFTPQEKTIMSTVAMLLGKHVKEYIGDQGLDQPNERATG